MGIRPAIVLHVNLKLALRTLVKRPCVTVIGVLSLALGIGATTAIFALYYQILVRPLPVSEPAALVNLASPGPKAGGSSCGAAGECDEVFSYPMFRDLEKGQTALEGIAGHVSFDANLAANAVTTSGQGMLVSGQYFELLGLKPALGRLIAPEDDRAPGATFSAVLSHAYWRTQFAESPGVLGQTIIVNGTALKIVGVAPQGFAGTTNLIRPQVFVPVTLRSTLQPAFDGGRVSVFENRKRDWLYLFGRLKAGTSIQTAGAQLNPLFSRIINETEVPTITTLSPQELGQFKAKKLLLEDGRRGQSMLAGRAGLPVNVLFAVSGFVLLIVCANLANLLLAQAAQRSAEISIRASLGGSRRQIVSQLLTESLLMAFMGGVGALLIARWTLDLIQVIVPESIVYLDYGIHPTSLIFASAITFAAGILFGLAPALQATRPGFFTALKAFGGRSTGDRRSSSFRTALSTAQIAVSLVLLVSAGLFAKSLFNISRVDLGFDVENVAVFNIAPGQNGYAPERSRALFERLEEELRALPGVTGVTAARIAVLVGDNWGNVVSVEGYPDGAESDRNASYNAIAPNYFSTLGIRFKAGRDFTPSDTLDQPKVAIVNEEFARKFNLLPNPIGKRMRIGPQRGPHDIEIVGMVQNARHRNLTQQTPPLVYQPYRQVPLLGTINFYVRTASTSGPLTGAITQLVSRLDSNLPIGTPTTMEEQARNSAAIERLLGVLSAAFAILATLIAAIGLYGILAYTVTQRTREIGLRLAVGARPSQICVMILGYVAKMALIGGALGIAGALGLGQLVQSVLYEIRGNDVVVLASGALILMLAVFAAGLIPAYRASKVHPMEALRYE